MNTFLCLTRRNIKLFFKDKGMFLVSMITPIILLVLYATFLANVYKSSITTGLPEGYTFDEKLINGAVAGQLLSSLLAVTPITVAFNSNMRMVQDRMAGIDKDFIVTPVKRSVLALSYFFGTLAATLLVCYAAVAIGLCYVAIQGWYMSFGDVMLLMLDVLVLSLFGTALSSIINTFLTSQGQMSAVGAIVSAGYGFVCGAYMPLSECAEWLRNVFGFLPGTYGTSLLRDHALSGAFAEMAAQGAPVQAIDGLRDALDCNLYFFGSAVKPWAMYLVICGSVVALIGAYVLINVLRKKRKK